MLNDEGHPKVAHETPAKESDLSLPLQGLVETANGDTGRAIAPGPEGDATGAATGATIVGTTALATLLELTGRRPLERISICRIEAGVFRAELCTVADAPAMAERYAAGDVYFSVQPLHERVRSGRGVVADVVGIRCVYTDLDVKPGGVADMPTARKVIDDIASAVGAGPVAIVLTGHGLQPYWAVEPGPGTDWTDEHAPAHAAGVALLGRWGRLVARIAAVHGARVDSVFDLARVLRAPGTVNCKSKLRVPTVLETPGGSPVTLEQIAGACDDYGIDAHDPDADGQGEVLAEASEWTFADRSCSYVSRMVLGWVTDTPAARHPWLVNNGVRLAAAHRLGCIGEDDHVAGVRVLAARMAELTRTPPARVFSADEIAEAIAWGQAKVERFDPARARTELGDHTHDGPPLVWVTGAPGAAGEPWPELVAIGHPPLPGFPVDVLPATLREFVLAVSALTQAPVDAAAMLCLAAIAAAAMGKARAVGHPGHIEELMLYVVIAMNSAERKTAVLDLVLKPVLDLERALREQREPDRLLKQAAADRAKATLKRLQAAAKRSADLPERAIKNADSPSEKVAAAEILAAMTEVEAIAVPAKSRLVLTSATPEALEVAMAENGGRIAMFSDESSIFGVMAGRYAGKGGSVDIDVFLHGHNGGHIRTARITRIAADIEHARLTLGLIVQPVAFDELANVRDADGRGLLGRPLYSRPAPVAGTRTYGEQQPIDPLVMFNFTARLQALGRPTLPASPLDINCTPAALALFTEFANRHEVRLAGDGDLAHIPSWAGKHVGQVLRIAGLLALWEVALDEPFSFGGKGPARICPEHITAAIAVGEYLIPHAVSALGALGRPEWMVIAARIIGWITRTKLTTFTERDCFTALAGSHSKVHTMLDMKQTWDALAERGYIREVPPELGPRGPGRPPSRKWETNPQVFPP